MLEIRSSLTFEEFVDEFENELPVMEGFNKPLYDYFEEISEVCGKPLYKNNIIQCLDDACVYNERESQDIDDNKLNKEGITYFYALHDGQLYQMVMW